MKKKSTSERTVLARGKYLALIKEGKWEYAQRTRNIGAAAIIAVTEERELVLTRQYRLAVRCDVIDLPAGLVGDSADSVGEEAIESARRELLEETGYDATDLKLAGTCTTSPGLCSEIVSLFLTRSARRVHDGGGVEGESIRVEVVPLRRLRRWLTSREQEGCHIDIKVYAALGLLK